jgi:hypothetical protein
MELSEWEVSALVPLPRAWRRGKRRIRARDTPDKLDDGHCSSIDVPDPHTAASRLRTIRHATSSKMDRIRKSPANGFGSLAISRPPTLAQIRIRVSGR